MSYTNKCPKITVVKRNTTDPDVYPNYIGTLWGNYPWEAVHGVSVANLVVNLTTDGCNTFIVSRKFHINKENKCTCGNGVCEGWISPFEGDVCYWYALTTDGQWFQETTCHSDTECSCNEPTVREPYDAGDMSVTRCLRKRTGCY